MINPLVSTDWLAAHLGEPDVRIADVRWYLLEKEKTGRAEYARGHIPGAVFIALETDLAAPMGEGRHPLPRPETFAEAMAHAGITPQTRVIAYDDRGGAAAARLWWLLRYFGHPQAALLDGGITQWNAEKRPLQIETPSVPRGAFLAQPHPEMIADKARVNTLRNDPHALILDVRVAERFAGTVEPFDPRAGHIPGAKHAPIADSLRSANDHRFRAPVDLHAQFDRLGASQAKTVVTYCGSGINACQAIFALNLAGLEHTLLYPGSWSDWSRDPSLPVATGAE